MACLFSNTFVISPMNPLWNNGVKMLITNTFVVCKSSYLMHLVLLLNWYIFAIALEKRGGELIFQESIRVNNEDNDGHHHETAFIDSTVQEKNITYPTDAKLHKKIIRKVFNIVHQLELPLRQSYTFVLKCIYRDQRFRNHPKNRQKAVRADRKLQTIAGRLVREFKRNLGEYSGFTELIEIFEAILAQRRHSGKKIYSIHEPEVQCISKGKEQKKYEFGNKVSIIRSATGVILGALSFRNEYDGHTIEASLAQVERLTQRNIKILADGRGYRGKKEVNGTLIEIPDVPKPSDSRYQKRKKHKLFCKRAGIEPTIGHLKSDHRLGCNFYKGVVGDAVNLLLAAAYNFKRAMRALLTLLKIISEMLKERESTNGFSLSWAF